MPRFEYSQVCDVGLVRTNNEDTVCSNEQLRLWLVADGMGGHAAGEVASKIASHTVEQAIEKGQDLDEAIHQAHQAILDSASNGEGKHGMGSTIVAMLSHTNSFQVSWVGDSRAYLWGVDDTGQTSLRPLTTDHSYVQMLFQSGIITEQELENHPEKNIITQCLGSNELEKVNVESIQGEWKNNDWMLLCSDGLSDALTDQALCDLLYQSRSPQHATELLLDASLQQGGKDNISIIVVAYHSDLTNKIKEKLRFFSKTKIR